MFRKSHVISTHCIRGLLLPGMALLGCFGGAQIASASITVEKMLLAETPEAFEVGVSYPVVGEHDAPPTYLSARVYKWTQTPDNMYVLEPSDDFSVFPELVRISPDTRRVVTIKASKPLPRGREGEYRIVLREFDRADGTDNHAPDEAVMGFRVKPQVSVPMIVRAPASAQAAPLVVEGVFEARAQQGGAGDGKPRYALRVRNSGSVYQRIVAVGINEAAGERNQMLGYVLPGQSIDLTVKVKPGDHVEVMYVSGPDAKVDIRSQKADDRKVVSWSPQ